MPVDSRDKRASVLGWGLASLLALPSPGVAEAGDRQQVAYSYRGLGAAAIAEVNICDGTTRSLVPVRRTESLVPDRETLNLVPIRRTRTHCP